MKRERTLREQLDARWGQLKAERSSWISRWQELSELFLPGAGRFFVEDRNRGDDRHRRILDNTATRSLRILSAGLMSGASSPARPWFRLTTSSPDLDESDGVKRWLADVTRLMQMVFARSNVYRALHQMYNELGVFGGACAVVAEDFDSVIHLHVLTAGEYCIATDSRGRPDTLYREFQMPVAQIVEEFGLENCSLTVKNLYDNGNLDQWITVMHVVEPRRKRDITKRDGKNMPYRSIYYESGTNSKDVLRESGYRRFNVLAPRWDVVGGDIYGTSPAMEALGDNLQLQAQQEDKSLAIKYQVTPPIILPLTAKDAEKDLLPGGTTYADIQGGGNAARSAWEVRTDINHLLLDMQDVRERIRSSFFVDVFLMFAGGGDHQITATEAQMLREEKMMVMGPVMERLDNELYKPLIDITFEIMQAAGILPPPPQELQGRDLNVEFVSVLAQAQRAIAMGATDQHLAAVINLAQARPDVLDKLDLDKYVDLSADLRGVDPELTLPADVVAAIRQQRADQQAAMQKAAMIQQGADAAAKLGGIDTSRPNAATDLMRGLQGYT
ncbi:MAG: hypothetical protein LBE50_03485 [Gallionellaceae bacterium]|nr:hypothetical protein [Gallionellaceae bacterium]